MRSHMLRAVHAPLYFGRMATGAAAGSAGRQVDLVPVTGTSQGDLIVAVCEGGTTATHTYPAGWTVSNLGSAIGRTVGYRFYNGAASYSITASTASAMSGVLMTFKAAAMDVIGSASVNATNPIAPAITAAQSNSIQVVCAGVTENSACSYSFPAGFTEIVDFVQDGGYSTFASMAIAIKTGVASGSTGTVTVTRTAGASANSRAWQFAVKGL